MDWKNDFMDEELARKLQEEEFKRGLAVSV